MSKKGAESQKPQMTEEQTKELFAAVQAAHKGGKLSPALIAIVAISVLGLIVYVYTAIADIGTRALMAYFPLIMYILMYVSIIKYVISFFAKGEDATIDGMLMRYCALTAASIVISGNGIDQNLLTVNVMILVLVPLMRENLKNAKKSIGIAAIVAVLCIVAAVIKMTAGAATFETLSGIALVAAVFDALNPTIQWLLFLALYLIRCKICFALADQIMAKRAAEAEGAASAPQAPTAAKEN